MTIDSLTPYVFFGGKARRAIALYERALGAKVESIIPLSEVPGATVAPGQEEWVVHAMLRIDGHALMLSDGMPSMPVAKESNVHVALDFPDPNEMTKIYDALAEGGTKTFPIHDTFYGGRLGVVTDAFGVHWTLNSMKAG